LTNTSIWGCDCSRGVDWILDLLTPLITASSYSAISNLHNSQITTAPVKHFLACCVFNSCSMLAASNSEDSSASGTQVLPTPTLVQNSQPAIPSTELDRHLFSASNARHTALNSLSIIFSAGLGSSLYSLGEDATENTVPNSSFIVSCEIVSSGISLPRNYVSSGSIIPAFRSNVTVLLFIFCVATYTNETVDCETTIVSSLLPPIDTPFGLVLSVEFSRCFFVFICGKNRNVVFHLM
jgi:hypothetical protein